MEQVIFFLTERFTSDMAIRVLLMCEPASHASHNASHASHASHNMKNEKLKKKKKKVA